MGTEARARLVGVAGHQHQLWFWCAGCETHHAVNVLSPTHQAGGWSWNGSVERPSVSPSVLVTYGPTAKRCHSFVTDGRIQYLDDCTHALKGQTVDLDSIAESMGESNHVD